MTQSTATTIRFPPQEDTKENVMSYLYCEAVSLKRTKLGEHNLQHSFSMKEGRNLFIFSG